MKIGPIPVRIYQNQLTHEAFALFTKLQELLQGWCLTSGDQVKFFPVFFGGCGGCGWHPVGRQVVTSSLRLKSDHKGPFIGSQIVFPSDHGFQGLL